MSAADPNLRDQAARRLQRYLNRDRFPRLTVMALLMLTGVGGFLAAVGMLRMGVDRMWIRYPLAVLVAYGVFIGLLRLWAEVERRRLAAQQALAEMEEAPKEKSSTLDPDSGSWFDWADLATPEWDEGCLLAAVIGAALAILLAALSIVAIAPALLAEVLLDVVLLGALYKHLRGIERHHWFVTVIRRTWAPALVAALVLSVAGAFVQAIRPDAKSIGQVWSQPASRPAR